MTSIFTHERTVNEAIESLTDAQHGLTIEQAAQAVEKLSRNSNTFTADENEQAINEAYNEAISDAAEAIRDL